MDPSLIYSGISPGHAKLMLCSKLLVLCFFASGPLFRRYRIGSGKKPVTAYAILTEASTLARPDSFVLDYMGTRLLYRFNTYKIAGQDEAELQASNNPFALVVLTARAALAGREIRNRADRDALLLALKLKLVRQLLAKEIPRAKIRVLMNFLRYYVRFENPTVNIKFDQEVDTLTGRRTTMGIEELLLELAEKKGIEKGEQKKSLGIVENLLLKLDLPDEEIALIAEVPLDFVKKVRAELQEKRKI